MNGYGIKKPIIKKQPKKVETIIKEVTPPKPKMSNRQTQVSEKQFPDSSANKRSAESDGPGGKKYKPNEVVAPVQNGPSKWTPANETGNTSSWKQNTPVMGSSKPRDSHSNRLPSGNQAPFAASRDKKPEANSWSNNSRNDLSNKRDQFAASCRDQNRDNGRGRDRRSSGDQNRDRDQHRDHDRDRSRNDWSSKDRSSKSNDRSQDNSQNNSGPPPRSSGWGPQAGQSQNQPPQQNWGGSSYGQNRGQNRGQNQGQGHGQNSNQNQAQGRMGQNSNQNQNQTPGTNKYGWGPSSQNNQAPPSNQNNSGRPQNTFGRDGPNRNQNSNSNNDFNSRDGRSTNQNFGDYNSQKPSDSQSQNFSNRSGSSERPSQNFNSRPNSFGQNQSNQPPNMSNPSNQPDQSPWRNNMPQNNFNSRENRGPGGPNFGQGPQGQSSGPSNLNQNQKQPNQSNQNNWRQNTLQQPNQSQNNSRPGQTGMVLDRPPSPWSDDGKQEGQQNNWNSQQNRGPSQQGHGQMQNFLGWWDFFAENGGLFLFIFNLRKYFGTKKRSQRIKNLDENWTLLH